MCVFIGQVVKEMIRYQFYIIKHGFMFCIKFHVCFVDKNISAIVYINNIQSKAPSHLSFCISNKYNAYLVSIHFKREIILREYFKVIKTSGSESDAFPFVCEQKTVFCSEEKNCSCNFSCNAKNLT